MNALLGALNVTAPVKFPNQFTPCAKYFAAMDCLIYLKESCAYRAVRLGPLITVLVHPENDTAVGVKIKGTRHVIERTRAILRSLGRETTEEFVLQVLTLLETAVTIAGDAVVEEAEAERRKKYWPAVQQLASEAGNFDSRSIQEESVAA